MQDVGVELTESIEQMGTHGDNAVDELYGQYQAVPDDEPEIEI